MKERGSPFTRSLRYFYLRFVRLRGTPEEVARGMALGVFIGMTPTMGVQIPIALFLAVLLKENKIAAILGVWVSNPMTAIPIYTFNFKVGKYMLGTADLKMPNFASLREVLSLGHDLLLPLWLGSFLVGLFSAAVAYVFTLRIYTFVKLEKEKLASKKWKKDILP